MKDKDEIQHSYFQTLVARQIVTEYPEVNTSETNQWIYDFFQEIVEKEKGLAIDMYGKYPGINMEELMGYIEWRANLLLQNLGLDRIFKTIVNPMMWINAYDPQNINGTRIDFFEARPTNYAKVDSDINGWDDL